jgi:hypothetical protein
MRASAASRFVSLAVVLALATPPVLEWRHAARTTHVACPADGRIEDAAEITPEPARSHAAGVVLDARGEPGQHSHRGCDAVPAARLRARTPTPGCNDVVPLALAVATVPADDSPRGPAVALYHVAPKLSPPL